MDRKAMSEAVSYRARSQSTVQVAALVLHPPEMAGVVLKALHGQLLSRRGLRNVFDLRAEPSAAATVEEKEGGSDATVGVVYAHQSRQWRLAVAPGECDALKVLLMDPSVLSAVPTAALVPMRSLPLSVAAAAAMGLPAAIAEKLNNATSGAFDSAAFNGKKRKRRMNRAGKEAEAEEGEGEGGGNSAEATGRPRRAMQVGLITVPVDLTYVNYTMPDLLRMVLPAKATGHDGTATNSTETEPLTTTMAAVVDGQSRGMNNSQNTAAGGLVALSGFEQVGHIAHVNLSKAHLPYQYVIGQVILDCNSTVGVVVNKTDAISSQFREFPMEVIAVRDEIQDPIRGRIVTAGLGEDELLTATVRQHGCVFEVPYNRVYWNSRLSNEHSRLVAMMATDRDVLFDVMAGVGPFAIPAARAGVLVHANDLNPASAEFMAVNRQLNRVDPAALAVYNWDGRDFMCRVVYDHVMGCRALPAGRGRKHVVMNLPATAVEFLDVFAPVAADPASAMKKPRTEGEQVVDRAAVPENEHAKLPGDHGWYRRHRWNYRLATSSSSSSSSGSAPLIDRTLLIHVYCFSPADNPLAEAVEQVERHLGYRLEDKNKECVFLVRDVAPQKRMVCVSFTLPDAFWANQAPAAVTSSDDV